VRRLWGKETRGGERRKNRRRELRREARRGFSASFWLNPPLDFFLLFQESSLTWACRQTRWTLSLRSQELRTSLGLAWQDPTQAHQHEAMPKGKSPRYLLNFRESPFFLHELYNQLKHLPQLLKPFILLPWPCNKQF
jgi:hypothetical protein